MIKQVYAPYTQWEDWQNGMFRNVSKFEFEELKQRAFGLLADHVQLLAAMQRCVNEWPVSASVNLTDKTLNHRPWLGQAACCIARQCTEDATRAAWSMLSIEQQRDANAQADLVFKNYLITNDTTRFQLWLEFA